MKFYHDRLRHALQTGRNRVARAWTVNAEARDLEGRPVVANDVTACRWCATGAVDASAIGMDAQQVANEAVRMLAAELPPAFAERDGTAWCKVQHFNDRTAAGNLRERKNAVLALFDKALARLDREARRI